MTLDELFDRCVVTPSGCEGRGGNYGKFSKYINGKPTYQYAHRHSYSLKTGKKVLKGFQVDHICARFLGHDGWNARRCCNPGHLEAVEGDQNQKRKFIVSEVIQPSLPVEISDDYWAEF